MGATSVVLVYHALGDAPRDVPLRNSFVPVPRFEAQMAALGRGWRVVGLDELLAPGDGRRVAITFDDGYRSVLTHAAPILERFGYPATVFVPTRFLGGRNEWDPPTDLPLDIMTGDEILELAGRGFEIGSHGHGHEDLGAATEDEAARDLGTSVERLAALVGRPPRFLAYPFGRSSPAARAVAESLGFDAAFAMEDGGGRYAHVRTPVYPFDRRWLFGLKASGRYHRWRHGPVVTRAYARVRPLLRGRRLWP